jgi:SAM-dependent methyltransferase
MLSKNISGLKFPDEFIVRFFFKEGLNLKQGRAIEMGCSNGNNLRLFYHFGWNVEGIDINKDAINSANKDFSIEQKEYNLNNSFLFSQCEMNKFCQDWKGTIPYDVLLFPGTIYYLHSDQIESMFKRISKSGMIASGTKFFFRMRTPQDYRWGRGEKISSRSWKMNITETGEQDCTLTFYSEIDFVDLVRSALPCNKIKIFHSNFDNLQNDCAIYNSDIIIWFEIK